MNRLFDFFENYFGVIFVVFAIFAVIGAVVMFVAVGQENPRCLLSADPILCLEVHNNR